MACRNCSTCHHHTKRDGMMYCKFQNFYPPMKLIRAMGCYYYKDEYLDLLNLKEDEYGKEKD